MDQSLIVICCGLACRASGRLNNGPVRALPVAMFVSSMYECVYLVRV